MNIPIPIYPRTALLDFLPCNSTQEHNPFAPGAFCFYRPPIGETLLHEMHAAAQQAVGTDLYCVSSFVRIHKHKTELHAHFDRRGLDWTISIPVEMDQPWPINVLENWEWVPKYAGLGEGVLVNGTVFPHCRLPYPGERAVILTLSYSVDSRYENDRLPAAAPAYLRLPKLLSKSTIDYIYRDFEKSILSPGMISHRNIPTTDKVNQIGWLTRPRWQWLYDLVESRMSLVNSMSWQLDIKGSTTDELQFTRYEPGEFYPWHVDCDPGAADQCRLRSLSTSVLLGNPISGGGIELRDGGVVPLGIGDAVIFPSTNEHRALKVHSGVRDSLVLWLSRRQ